MTVADVRQFYEDFYGTQNGSVALVGSFDKAPMKVKLKKDLGSWKAAKPYTRIPTQLFADLKPKTEAIQTDEMKAAKAAKKVTDKQPASAVSGSKN